MAQAQNNKDNDNDKKEEISYDKIDFAKAQSNYIEKFGEPKITFDLKKQKQKQQSNDDGKNTDDNDNDNEQSDEQDWKEYSLDVVINSNRLTFTSTKMNDFDNYYNDLFSKENIMKYYASGKTSSKESVTARVKRYYDRWQSGYPFSGFTITLNENEEKRRDDKNKNKNKNKNKDKISNFVGFIVSGNGDVDNASEIAYILSDKHWGNGYGYEALGCISLFYMPFLIKHNKPRYFINTFKPKAEIVTRIVATSRVENIPSSKILAKCGYHTYKQTEKWGFKRHEWELVFPIVD